MNDCLDCGYSFWKFNKVNFCKLGAFLNLIINGCGFLPLIPLWLYTVLMGYKPLWSVRHRFGQAVSILPLLLGINNPSIIVQFSSVNHHMIFKIYIQLRYSLLKNNVLVSPVDVDAFTHFHAADTCCDHVINFVEHVTKLANHISE